MGRCGARVGDGRGNAGGAPESALRRSVSGSETGGGKLSGKIEHSRIRRVAIAVGASRLPTDLFGAFGGFGPPLAALLLGGFRAA